MLAALKNTIWTAALAGTLFAGSALAAPKGQPTDQAATPNADKKTDKKADKKERTMSFFDLSAKTLDDKPQPLAAYKGKVVLVVNTASECGFTPQYAGLEKLWQEYKDRGVVVLGFPSNDFGGQEPGSAQEIKSFCSTRFRITFPMFEKVKTKGDGQSPVYQFLAAKHGEPKWNFHKYVVGKDGQVKQAFPSKVAPEDRELRDALDAALKE